MTTRTIPHTHTPVYRVVQRGWTDPLDASYSQRADDNRWNTRAFPALYCCCSERVAAVLVRDRLRRLQLDLDDLTPDAQPQVVEIDWTGRVVDMVSETGIAGNGFAPAYPDRATIAECQTAAGRWHARSHEGIVCRSASVHRLAPATPWTGDHAAWGELAVFPDRAARKPALIRRRSDLDWIDASRPLP